jgi:ankyrin repeat protein
MRLLLLVVLNSLLGFAGESRLIDAIRDQDRPTINLLIQNHADVNVALPDGSTPLQWAAYENDVETVAMLLKAGARVNVANEYGETPLTLACAVGNVSIVENLLRAGADVRIPRENGETALMIAAAQGNTRLVRILIEHGSDVNAVEARKGQNALIWAVANDHPKVVDILLRSSADPNLPSKAGLTPLMFAAAAGDTRIVTRLLGSGARINYTAPDGTNALRVALRSRKNNVVKTLILRGANFLTAGDLIAAAVLHQWNRLSDSEAGTKVRNHVVLIEIGLAVLGFILALRLIALIRSNKSTRAAWVGLLFFSVLLTAPLAFGNPFIAQASTHTAWTSRGIAVALTLLYCAAAFRTSRKRSYRASHAPTGSLEQVIR